MLVFIGILAVFTLPAIIGKPVFVLAVLWFIAVTQFFRDPLRKPPIGDQIVVSPADGRVIDIGTALDSPLNPDGTRVSIFMSPLNVHVNVSPYHGYVKSVEYREGRFLSAFKPEASLENQHQLIVLDTRHGLLAFKQISGFLARRCIFHPRLGDHLETGQRVGMIKFGSRLDLFLPVEAEIKVELGDKVTAGESIIAEFKIEQKSHTA